MGAGDLGGIDARGPGKCNQQILVSQNMLEHASEKVGLARGFAHRLRSDASRRDKAAEPAVVLGNEAKRLDRQCFGRFW